jgi:diguanylate cyclase (GGDEF)-like protein/PAS domain S-box-containing protein
VAGPERNSEAIGRIPPALLLVSRLAMGGVILFYVLTEPRHAGNAAPAWVGTAGIVATVILFLCAILQWLTPEGNRAAGTAWALIGFATVNGLLVTFSFDSSQPLFLVGIMSALEISQLGRRTWLLPLTGIVLVCGTVSALVLGPIMGAEPHVALLLVRSVISIGIASAIDSFVRTIERERRRVAESEEQFRTVFDEAPVGMSVADVEEQRIRRVNRAYVEMLGYPEEELLGKRISDFTLAEDYEHQRRAIDEAIRLGRSGYRLTKRYRRPDGRIVTADVATSLVRNAAGVPTMWIAQGRDVTEQLAEESRRREAELRYRALAENFPDGAVFVFDANHRLLLMEGRELDAFGTIPAEEGPRGRSLPEEVAEPMRRLVVQALEGIDAEGQLVTGGRTFEVDAVPITAEGEPQVMVVAIDVTMHKDLEERMLHSNTELQRALSEMQLRSLEAKTLSEMGDLLAACVDEAETHDVLARTVPRLFPRTAGAVYVMRSSRNLLEATASWGGMPPDESSLGPDECWALRRGRSHNVDDADREVICRHVTPGASMSYVCVPMLAHGETLGILHVRAEAASLDDKATRADLIGPVAEQISLSLANFRLRETLRMQSIQDPLTGLYNRRFMHEFLNRQLERARRHGQSLSVLMIDVDHLKMTNDTFGHEAGDELIKDVARVLTAAIRGGDVACRFGGDEFTIVATDAGLEEAAALADRLRTALRELAPGIGLDPQHRPDLSIGVAAAPDHGWDAEILLRLADEALYRAKDQGRGRVAVAATA